METVYQLKPNVTYTQGIRPVQKLFLIIMLVSVLFACANVNSQQDDNHTFDLEEFDLEEFYTEFKNARAAWERMQINHYRFIAVHNTSASPAMPISITVYPNRRTVWKYVNPVHYEYDLGWRERIHPFIYIEGTTITELYASLENYILRANSHDVYSRSTAKYHSEYHYPEEFFWIRGRPGSTSGAGGNGMMFEITNFEVLP